MSAESIINYIKVSGRISSSGQPNEHEFKWISQSGFQVVINLAMPDSENAIPEEGYIVTANKMTYVHIPVPFDSPNVEHLRQFLRVMRSFLNHQIWVHCALNYRVSAFLFHYHRLIEGEEIEHAKRVMLPSWKPNPIWQKFLALADNEIAL